MASSITRRGRCLQLIGRGQAWRRLQSQLYGPRLEVGHSMSVDIPLERMGHLEFIIRELPHNVLCSQNKASRIMKVVLLKRVFIGKKYLCKCKCNSSNK